MRADRLLGAIAAIGGAALLAAALRLETVARTGVMDTRMFPAALGVVLLVVGLWSMLRPGSARLSDALRKLAAPRGIAFAALLLVYALTFRWIDFRLGTWAFVLASIWLLGSRSLLELLLFPPLVALAVWWVFRYGFIVMLPTWS